MGWRGLSRAIPVAALGALLAASDARAAMVSVVTYRTDEEAVDDGQAGLFVKGATGDRNALRVSLSAEPAYVVQELARGVVLQASEGCRQVTFQEVHCPITGLRTARVESGDLDDTIGFTLTEQDTISADGEAGPDQLFGSAFADDLGGGLDNDLLTGNAGNDFLNGAAGIDDLTGGTGADTLVGGNDNDKLRARDAVADTRIDCGLGTADFADLDLLDPGPAGCESVNRGAIHEGAHVTITRGPLRLSRNGRGRIALTCPDDLAIGCEGTLTAGVGGITGRSVAYRLRAGQTGRVAVRLTRSQRRRLGRVELVSVERGEFGDKTTIRRRTVTFAHG